MNSIFSENIFSDAGFLATSSSLVNISSTTFTAFKSELNFTEKLITDHSTFLLFISSLKSGISANSLLLQGCSPLMSQP